MFKRVFGGGNQGKGAGGSTGAQTINAIQNLNDREEQLEKKKALLEKKINEELEKARAFTREKKKNQALMCLKKKKMYEQQLQQIDTLVSRVLEQKAMLDNQQTTLQVVGAMQEAAKAQKQSMKDMKIDNVESVIDEIQDVGDQMRQIQDAMANPIGGVFGDMDMDELDAEMQELEESELESQLLEPAPVPTVRVPAKAQVAQQQLPSAPQTRVPAQRAKTDAERELEELEAEMAM